MIITISRQAATNGDLIAHLVAERLNLRVIDREVVDEVARRLQVDPKIINRIDDLTLNPVEAVLLEWRNSLNEEIYGRYLRQALKQIAHEDNAVIIGRGANHIIKSSAALHVRIVAPMSLRIAMYIAGENSVETKAKQYIHDEDKRRADFIHRQFKASIDDPLNYDLCVNLGGLTTEMAADLIAQAARMRQSAQLAAEPKATLPLYIEVMRRHRRPSRPSIVER